MRKFPPIIHVTLENPGTRDQFLNIGELGIASIAEVGENKPCALYKLIEVGSIVAPASYVPPKRKQR